MAVPILNHIGLPVAAISVSFPLFRYDESARARYIETLRSVGEETSKAMGYYG